MRTWSTFALSFSAKRTSVSTRALVFDNDEAGIAGVIGGGQWVLRGAGEPGKPPRAAAWAACYVKFIV